MTLAQIKEVVRYRVARAGEGNCGICAKSKNFNIHNCGTGEIIGQSRRCPVIGLKESRRYAVSSKYVCYRYEAETAGQ